MCLLNRAKLICLGVILYNKNVKNLRNRFIHNGHPQHFFDVAVNKSESVNEPKSSKKSKDINFSYKLNLPYFGRPSQTFHCNVAKLVRNNFYVDIAVFYKTLKTGTYF